MAFFPNVDLTAIKRLFRSVEQPGPFIVTEVISPVIDIQKFIFMLQREWVNTFVVLTAVGQTLTHTIPEGEQWLIHAIASSTDTLDADQTVSLQQFITPTNVGGLGDTGTKYGRVVAVGNSEQGGSGQVFENIVIFPSGSVFGVAVNQLTIGVGGDVRLSLTALISRITL